MEAFWFPPCQEMLADRKTTSRHCRTRTKTHPQHFLAQTVVQLYANCWEFAIFFPKVLFAFCRTVDVLLLLCRDILILLHPYFVPLLRFIIAVIFIAFLFAISLASAFLQRATWTTALDCS